MLQSTEKVLLEGVALLITAAVLLAIADTPAYPLAIGIEIIALLIVLLNRGPDLISRFLGFIANPAAAAGG